jgi:hypothetical protein
VGAKLHPVDALLLEPGLPGLEEEGFFQVQKIPARGLGVRGEGGEAHLLEAPGHLLSHLVAPAPDAGAYGQVGFRGVQAQGRDPFQGPWENPPHHPPPAGVEGAHQAFRVVEEEGVAVRHPHPQEEAPGAGEEAVPLPDPGAFHQVHVHPVHLLEPRHRGVAEGG